ncbi:MAG: YceI family protein [Rhodovibrionaceae bacterium]
MNLNATLAVGLLTVAGIFASATSAQAAEEYKIDPAHSFIEFKIQHLGYSWLHGRFNEFSGGFTVDRENPANAGAEITIATGSIDSNHAERDKHLRSGDFLSVDEHPEARFVATSVTDNGDGTGTIEGELTLRGQTNPVEIAVEEIGHGEDPWGGYRAGFEGTASIALADYGIDYDLGPAAAEVQLTLGVEGVRQ